MPSYKEMKESIPKLLFLSIFSNNFFCNHKDYIGQINSDKLKLAKEKEKEWDKDDWFKIYNCGISAYDYVAVQRTICLLAYFDFVYKVI